MKVIIALQVLFINVLFCCQINAQDFERQRMNLVFEDHNVQVAVIDSKLRPKNNRAYYWSKGREVYKTFGGIGGKVLNGNYQSFHNNGQLYESGTFKKGVKNGTWKEWTNKGIPVAIITYRVGVENGIFINYDETGNVKRKGIKKDGKLHGTIYSYDLENKEVLEEYRNGAIYQKKKKKNFLKGLLKRKKKEEKPSIPKEKKQEEKAPIVNKNKKEEPSSPYTAPEQKKKNTPTGEAPPPPSQKELEKQNKKREKELKKTAKKKEKELKNKANQPKEQSK